MSRSKVSGLAILFWRTALTNASVFKSYHVGQERGISSAGLCKDNQSSQQKPDKFIFQSFDANIPLEILCIPINNPFITLDYIKL
jgi:hypothetical protein